MFNEKLMKFRLLAERAAREQEVAEEKCEAAWKAYRDEANRLGLCRACFQPLTESNKGAYPGICKDHILLGADYVGISSWPNDQYGEFTRGEQR